MSKVLDHMVFVGFTQEEIENLASFIRNCLVEADIQPEQIVFEINTNRLYTFDSEGELKKTFKLFLPGSVYDSKKRSVLSHRLRTKIPKLKISVVHPDGSIFPI